jgi:hypothetical protein
MLTLLLCVSLGSADLLKPQPASPKERIMAQAAKSYSGVFKSDESAAVQLFGDGHSSLLLYVFDARGNCVAWDDNITRAQFCDELGAEWIAEAAGRYTVDVRNVGLDMHEFTLAIR